MARYGYSYTEDTNSRLAYSDDERWSRDSHILASSYFCLGCGFDFIATAAEHCPSCECEEIIRTN